MRKFILSILGILALEANAQITELPVSANPTNISPGQSSTISTTGSQEGVNYSLRNSNNTVVDGPTAGTGFDLAFNTGVLTVSDTFNVYASSTNSVGLRFDGYDDYLSIPIDTSFDYSAGYSYEAWVKTPVPFANSYHPVFFIGSSGISDIEVYTSTGFLAVVYDRNRPGQNVRTYPTPPNNTWSHLAITFDGNTTKVYYDGVQQTPQTGSASGSMTRSAGTEINIGGITYTGFPVANSINKYTEGTFDDLRIWNTERSISEISNNRSACLTGTEPGMEAFYKLNDLNGSEAMDELGNNHAALTNMDTLNAWNVVSSNLVPCGVNLNMQMAQTATVTVNIVGIDEQETQTDLLVYPNPATSQITIDTEDKIEAVKVIDATGKTVISITQNPHTIDVSDLPKGLYILSIKTHSGIAHSRFIKE